MSNIRALRPFRSKYNKFNLGHSFDLSFSMGYAIPVLVQNFVPGDSFRITWDQLCRMVPLKSPAYSKIMMRFDAFRCDNHQVWPDFENAIKQVETGSNNTYQFPYIQVPVGGFPKGSLSDYLGFAVNTGDSDKVDALVYRHYCNIINNYYINSNIQNEIEFSTSGGLDTVTPISLRHVNYRQDRFTGAETTTLRGSSTILPIGNLADVISTGDVFKLKNVANNGEGTMASDGIVAAGVRNAAIYGAASGVQGDLAFGSNTGLKADLSSVTGVDVNLLNTMEQINRYKVLSLLAGNHYPDWQELMYGVRSSDSRLQIPQWLGSYKAPFVVSEVLQTSQTTDSSPQGTMAGHGFSSSNGGLFIPRLNSFGYIMIIMTVMPQVVYDQGLPAMYNKFDPYDFANPLFANMPLQGIKKSELYWQKDSVVDSDGKSVNDGNFGFAPVYDDYRYRSNHLAGDFHDTLSYMVVRRHFDSLPVLNEAFIQAEDNIGSELFSVDPAIQHPLYSHIDFKIISLRKLPKLGLPKPF